MSAARSAVDGGGTEPRVKLLSRETVLPASPTPGDPFFLSCLDIMWQDIHYNRRFLFYSRPCVPASLMTDKTVSAEDRCSGGDSQASRLLQHLKRSLSLCLVEYFCWCGRLARAADPPHRFYIDCNDAGVEFTEATVDMPLSLLARDGFQMKPFFTDLCPAPDHRGSCLFSSPLLTIQATIFEDGGLSLGVAASHVVVDGLSLWNFMASWGECSRGLQLSHAPVLDRKRLAVATPSIEKANQWRFCSGLNKQDQVDVQAEINRKVELPTEKCEGKDRSDLSSSITMEKKEADPSSLEEREQHVDGGTEKDRDANELDCSHSTSHVQHLTDIKPVNDLVQCVLVMSDSAIRRLKIEAGEGYTSLEVLCAHFWQRISIAKKAGPGECTYLLVPINYRDRIKQPLPATYFGNVIGYSVVVTIASKIREQPLGATTSRIHAQLLADKCGSIEPFMHWLETHDNCLTPLWLSSPMVHYNGVNVASSPWFPAYEVDFGWDKPAAVRAAKVSWI